MEGERRNANTEVKNSYYLRYLHNKHNYFH